MAALNEVVSQHQYRAFGNASTGCAYSVTVGISSGCKPDQNALIGRFDRSYREEALDAYLLEDLDQQPRVAVQLQQRSRFTVEFKREAASLATRSGPHALFSACWPIKA